MITIKLPIQNKVQLDYINYIKQYNSVVRFAYNRFKEEDKKLNDIVKLAIQLNNIELLDRSFIEFAVQKAKDIYSRTQDEKVIFGGKNNFLKRLQNKITKEQYQEKRLLPLTSIGRSVDKGNRKFQLDVINSNQVIFKPNRNNHFILQLPKLSKNYKKFLFTLEEKSRNKEEPFTVSLTKEYISITFNECIIKELNYTSVNNRTLAIDLNPNYLGYSICDYDNENKQHIIAKEVISIKSINNINVKGLPSTSPKFKYIKNKRDYEVVEISKYIINKAKHYKVETIGIEKLDIEIKDHGKGKSFNKLVNGQWNRNKFINNLKKRSNIVGIQLKEIIPQYSSFVGQLQNPNDVDSIAASLELNRRTNLFNQIYLKKTIAKQNIIFPEFKLNEVLKNQWKKDLGSKVIKSWKSLYQALKESKTSYRFLYDSWIISKDHKVFRLQSYKSLVAIAT